MGRALRSAKIDHLIADTAGLLASRPMRVPGTRIAVREVRSAVRGWPGSAHTMPGLAAVRPGPADARRSPGAGPTRPR